MPQFRWNPSTSRYEMADGRTIREDKIRAALDMVIDAQALIMRQHTQALVDGTLPLGTWTVLMMTHIKAAHLVATAVAAGGWANLDQTDFGWVGQRVREQYRYLVKFSVEISSGLQPLNGTVLSRAGMYAAAARDTHREAARRLMRARMIAGEEKSNLGVADHCKVCVLEAKKGWQPFGVLLAIGRRTCLSNCRCWFTYRTSA